MPALSEFERILGELSVEVIPIPHDCCDGFLGAYWRRPQAYLDWQVRSASSTFAKLVVGSKERCATAKLVFPGG